MSVKKIVSHLAVVTLIASGAVASAYAIDQSTNRNQFKFADCGAAATSSAEDAAITDKVRTALLSHQISGISVTTDQGLVTLAGIVSSEEVRQKATRVALAVDSVQGVDYTDLAVKAAGA